jgi:hypothetical protein
MRLVEGETGLRKVGDARVEFLAQSRQLIIGHLPVFERLLTWAGPRRSPGNGFGVLNLLLHRLQRRIRSDQPLHGLLSLRVLSSNLRRVDFLCWVRDSRETKPTHDRAGSPWRRGYDLTHGTDSWAAER